MYDRSYNIFVMVLCAINYLITVSMNFCHSMMSYGWVAIATVSVQLLHHVVALCVTNVL